MSDNDEFRVPPDLTAQPFICPNCQSSDCRGWRLLIRRGLSASVDRRTRHGILYSNYASAENAGQLSRLTWRSGGKA